MHAKLKMKGHTAAALEGGTAGDGTLDSDMCWHSRQSWGSNLGMLDCADLPPS